MLIILDRDGVLNQDRENYVLNTDQLVILPQTADALKMLTAAGHTLVVATNQSCIGKGILNWHGLQTIHNAIQQHTGNHIKRFYVCPDNHASHRRKPAAGMLVEAMTDFGYTPQNTVFIGDALRDLQAASTACVQPILVRTGKGAKTENEQLPDDTQIFDSLYAYAAHIIR